MRSLLLIVFTLLVFPYPANANGFSVKAKIDGNEYVASFNRASNDVLIYDKQTKKTVVFKNKFLFDADIYQLDFKDFNGDGYKDLIISYRSNVPEITDLIVYDKAYKRFVLINNFPDYPAAIKLKGTSLFYSYHRSGCADANWDSDLFKIINFKIAKKGNINCEECVNPPEKPGIVISRITVKKRAIIKRYPLTEYTKFKDTKWGFIAWYWKKYYASFN